MRLTPTFVALLFVPCLAAAQQSTYRPYSPPNGFVPDSATAVSIAVAIWTPIYGDVQFMTEHPVTATLHDGIWTVTGHVPSKLGTTPYTILVANDKGDRLLPLSIGEVGDTAVVKIAKRDGRILYQGRS